MNKFLVTWYDGDRERVSLIEPKPGTFPFAVEPDMVHPDCEHINVIVGVADNFEPDIVVINDEEAMIEGAD